MSDSVPPDLTINTSDGTEIRTHKLILSVHSSVFRDMFVVGGTGQDQVSVSEDRQTMEALLRCCYTGVALILDNLDLRSLWSARLAARKYMMEEAESRILPRVNGYVQREPLRVYALACRDGFESEAREAALSSLRQPAFRGYVPELEEMSAADGAVIRLMRFREKCADSVSDLFFTWIKYHELVFTAPYDRHSGSCACTYARAMRSGIEEDYCWGLYAKGARSLLKKKPCGNTVMTSDIVWPTLQVAATCKNCRNRAHQDMEEFLQAYAEMVDKTTKPIAQTTTFTAHA
ncbi:hypothetical protein NEOLEDRAFT_1139216 [Neolentinus lepideus HHB14362 ss-1]|uniref:BTB domain-containing protein n=1 Tax=Neolentinus lepideus HHB14362 ss-1 TaxID=1314782 RepID=A0A165PWQ4_9AGAM|nr:hypothetical protein NEOLEDRAFT_1139216 [Neolentinus lepideus HHB14362 ss-1]